jgi:hypothetical protein
MEQPSDYSLLNTLPLEEVLVAGFLSSPQKNGVCLSAEEVDALFASPGSCGSGSGRQTASRVPQKHGPSDDLLGPGAKEPRATTSDQVRNSIHGRAGGFRF